MPDAKGAGASDLSPANKVTIFAAVRQRLHGRLYFPGLCGAEQSRYQGVARACKHETHQSPVRNACE